MARGTSGRIVIDVDPEFKDEVYRALAQQGSTLKDWFILNARELCEEARQPSLPFMRMNENRYPEDKVAK